MGFTEIVEVCCPGEMYFGKPVPLSDAYTSRVDRHQIHAAIAEVRRGIADLIDDLVEAQLAAPSLCAGWDVKSLCDDGCAVGRTAVLDALDGPGLPLLRQRISG